MEYIMPPKVKISKEQIIETAFELVRVNGEHALNARAIACALNCSTQPVFSNFESMNDLHQAVIEKAYQIYLSFLQKEAESGKYPKYKAFGMAYIRFASEEKELFKLLFMRDRRGEGFTPTPDFIASTQLIMQNNSVTKEVAELIHLEVWTCVHGIATMLATSFLTLNWELISNILSDVYGGIREKHLNGANKK